MQESSLGKFVKHTPAAALTVAPPLKRGTLFGFDKLILLFKTSGLY
jgi:hypothetical protein